eukprot:9234403-Karenia_brevis.AAC.1
MAVFQQQVTSALQSACTGLVRNSFGALSSQVDTIDRRVDNQEVEIQALKSAVAKLEQATQKHEAAIEAPVALPDHLEYEQVPSPAILKSIQ